MTATPCCSPCWTRDADLAPVVGATEGVTASYIKELLRRAVLAAFCASDDAVSLTDADLATAVTGLSAERQALTRSLLGQPATGRQHRHLDLDDDQSEDDEPASDHSPGPSR